jgi:GTP-binding protein HflX
MFDRYQGGEQAVLVHIDFQSLDAETNQAQIAEFVELVTSAGIAVLELLTSRRNAPHAKFYVGTGLADQLADLVQLHKADVIIFNHSLSPAQERNLEAHCKCRVVDRIGLILDIFAQRASTYEGKLQVELAQLKHLSTRLIRGWTHLERQKGGIGLRGPGETQLETDRRLLRGRIDAIEARLAKVSRQREQGRRARKRTELPTVSVVGYTNAGKSTLFNQLTEADVYAQDQLFATLDPTLRRLTVGSGQDVILADTVGFIRDLPHDLVAAFRATLEETRMADLLLHIIDASDPQWQEKQAAVEQVLEEIGATDVPLLKVMNKIDLVPELAAGIEEDAEGLASTVYLSAQSGSGLDELKQAIAQHVSTERLEVTIKLQPSDARLRGLLYDLKAVIDETVDDHGNMQLALNIALSDWRRLEQNIQISLDDYIV